MEAFVGTIMAVGFPFAPRGWAFCNGQLMSIAQNSALFSLLGTNYGGDGIQTFGIPDLRGRVAVGAQSGGPGLEPIAIGQKAGTNNVTVIGNGAVNIALTAANLPGHTHPGAGLTAATAINVGTTGSTTNTPTPEAGSYLCATVGGPGGANIYLPPANAPATTVALNAAVTTTTVSGTTGSAGTGTPLAAPVQTTAITPIMQPYLGLNYIICLDGLFPSRN